MRFFVRHHVSRKILFRLDGVAWSRFDFGVGWTPVDVDVEAFHADPFVDEISADQARELEAGRAPL